MDSFIEVVNNKLRLYRKFLIEPDDIPFLKDSKGEITRESIRYWLFWQVNIGVVDDFQVIIDSEKVLIPFLERESIEIKYDCLPLPF